jgi:anthranilate phosphoribosyltransferase
MVPHCPHIGVDALQHCTVAVRARGSNARFGPRGAASGVACNLLNETPMQFVSDIRKLVQRDFLDEESLARLWGAVLDGALDGVEVGAILAALAVAGETREELCALHRAAQERMEPWALALPARAVAIPAYGLVHGESLLVGLAATFLRRCEIPVVVHGILDSPCGIGTACVLREMGVLPCASLLEAEASLREQHIAFVPVQLLAPRFAALLGLRARLGIENAAHLVAPALDPTRGGALRLAFAESSMRGQRFELLATEAPGDFVSLAWPMGRSAANLGARPRMECIRGGLRELLFEADVTEVRTATAQPPDDAAGIARWIGRVDRGEVPVPVTAVSLVAACLYALGYASDFTQAKAMAAVSTGRLAA